MARPGATSALQFCSGRFLFGLFTDGQVHYASRPDNRQTLPILTDRAGLSLPMVSAIDRAVLRDLALQDVTEAGPVKEP